MTIDYFLCKITEGQITYADPDKEIEEVAWKTSEDLLMMQHEYPEDLEMLLSFFNEDALKV